MNQIKGIDVIRVANILWTSTMSIKALILFKLFDENEDERVSVNEIETFYRLYLSEFNIFPDNERSNEAVELFLQGFFPNEDGSSRDSLSFQQFYEIFERNPSLSESLYLISVPDQSQEENLRCYQKIYYYITNNITKLVLLFIYLLTMIGLMAYVIVAT